MLNLTAHTFQDYQRKQNYCVMPQISSYYMQNKLSGFLEHKFIIQDI